MKMGLFWPINGKRIVDRFGSNPGGVALKLTWSGGFVSFLYLDRRLLWRRPRKASFSWSTSRRARKQRNHCSRYVQKESRWRWKRRFKTVSGFLFFRHAFSEFRNEPFATTGSGQTREQPTNNVAVFPLTALGHDQEDCCYRPERWLLGPGASRSPR